MKYMLCCTLMAGILAATVLTPGGAFADDGLGTPNPAAPTQEYALPSSTPLTVSSTPALPPRARVHPTAKKTPTPVSQTEFKKLQKEVQFLRRVLRLGIAVHLTSYTGGDPAQGTGSRTALGTTPSYGQVAVDPRVFPLGSYLWIPGYGIGYASDTGGAIIGTHVDLCFGIGWEAYRAALRFGSRDEVIYPIPKDILPEMEAILT
jgi:3D (Asp-Asp-Asp) domain-containing protein